jgi:hypothetical protein
MKNTTIKYSWIICLVCAGLTTICMVTLEPEVPINKSEFLYLTGLFLFSSVLFYFKRRIGAEPAYKINEKIHYAPHSPTGKIEILMGEILDYKWNSIMSEFEYLIEDQTKSPYAREWRLEHTILDGKAEKVWNGMSRKQREESFDQYMKIIKPHKKYRKQTPEAKAIILRRYNTNH